MADQQPVAISDIDDPSQVRVMLYQSGKMVHAPLSTVAPPSTGDFAGPASAVADNVVTFADASGKVGKDSGVGIATLAPLASPAFTGTPTAPTATAGTSTTQLATTGFVAGAIALLNTAIALLAPKASPTFTGVPAAPTAAGGTNTTQLATTAFVLAALASAKLQKLFESAQQTLTAGGALTLAHGLGGQPKLMAFSLVCQTAQGGYAVGDETEIPPSVSQEGTGVSRGVACVPDATNLNIRIGSDGIDLIRKDTGALIHTTLSSWKLVVRAWA